MSKISDYQTSGNATGLARIGAEPFTIVKVQDSSYDGQPSVRIMTQTPIKVDGVEDSEFYTRRKAILDTLSNTQFTKTLETKQISPNR